MRNAILCGFFTLLAGCAGSALQLSGMDAEELRTVSTDDLISAIGTKSFRTEAMLTEAMRRKLFTYDELSLVRKRQITVGISETALLASWGPPAQVNRSVSAYGVNKQYVYGAYTEYGSPKFVYVDDGKVTSWQD